MKTTKVIGPLEIYENQVLGVGSSGSVFKGTLYFEKGKLKKSVSSQNSCFIEELEIAVKVIPHSQRSQNQVTQYLFESEKEALIKLSHPNVIKCFGMYEDNTNSYYATQFIRGGTLKDYIKQKGKITEKDAVYILKKLLNAVHYINTQGFIHRDIKPANIMIRQLIDSNTQQRIFQPIIIDFGYAQRIHARWKPQMFYNVGSPSYMAPQSYKQTNYTQKSDLWALGVVFFEILTGDTFDSNVKIDQLFRQPAFYIQKTLAQKKYCLSTRSLKILRNILVVNENIRPNLESMLKFVTKIQQTYRIPQLNHQKEQLNWTERQKKQTGNKNIFEILKSYKVQQRPRISSYTVTPQNSQKIIINERKVYERSPQHYMTVVTKRQDPIIRKIRSQRVLTNPIQISKINHSFVQSSNQGVFQMQQNLSFKKNNNILSVSNAVNQNLSIRRNYHSPSPSILNPEMKKLLKLHSITSHLQVLFMRVLEIHNFLKDDNFFHTKFLSSY